MATNESSRETPGFIADTQSPEAIRRQFIEQPLEASRQPVLETATELLGLMALLPKAFAASQRREYQRLARTVDDDKDPRLAFMKQSLERAEQLRDMAALGQTRIERALVAVGGDGDVFHGFVQDGGLRPRAGVIVQISDARETSSKPLSASTDKDGYFSIALGKRATPRQKAKAIPVGLSARMAELLDALDRRGGQAEAAPGTNADAQADTKNQARVEIFDASGKLLHADPYPLVLDGGSAYREYVIGDKDAATGKIPNNGDTLRPPKPAPGPAPTPTPAPAPAPTPAPVERAAASKKASATKRTAKRTAKPATKPKPGRKPTS